MDQIATPDSEAAIQFLNGPLAEKIISIQKAECFIGRHEQNDVVVFDPKVSRQHARIFYQNSSWSIENLSQNGSIFIEQERVQQRELQHKVVVHLSENTSFVFLVTQQAIPQTVLRAPSPSVTALTTPLATQVTPANKVEALDNDVFHTYLAIKPSIGMPSLIISSNIHSNQQTHLLTKPVTNIGRTAENDLVIADPIISAHHAQIVREEDALFFIHPHPSRNNTLNGLWYQGQRIAGDQPFRKQLTNGDIFRVGDEHGTLITLTYNDGSGTFHETLPELAPVPLNSDRLTIGRVPDNTVVLNHPQISAHHALLEKIEGGYRILDTNSTNHVYVNGQPITNHLLRTGDEIRIGPYHFTYTGAELKQYDESNHIRIDALQLKKTGNNATVLLNDISLVIPPRKFVALVGGSGAGKSTLMDALNGLRPAQEGMVLYNGVDYYHNMAAFNTQLGYVPQDDIVHRELTVERALYYAARLRLPEDFTRKQIQWRIDEVLEDVEMTDRRGLLVSKLSGGQRKRVSIALELLANPSVFFLDEPTSGLDPGLDRKMMSLLRRLADRGRTIVLVTHATNNINACDYVCFLAQGGRLAYFGPPNAAKEFFEKTDFAEIYSTLEPTKEQPNIPEQAETRFRASSDYQRYVAEPLSEKRVQANDQALKTTVAGTDTRRRVSYGKGWSQFLLLSMRYLELLKNDRGNLLILLLQAPVIALMLVLMVRFEIGTGVFDANKLVQCHTEYSHGNGSPRVTTVRPDRIDRLFPGTYFLTKQSTGAGIRLTQWWSSASIAKLSCQWSWCGCTKSALYYGFCDRALWLY